MKRILVIGAKGMLGRDLVEVLRASSEDEVIGWDIDEIDIRVEKDTIAKIDHVRPDIVINVAAYTNVDECESQAEKAFAVNAEGMKHVALGASRCGAKIVYLSTDYVFDGGKGVPYLEEDRPRHKEFPFVRQKHNLCWCKPPWRRISLLPGQRVSSPPH